MLRSLQKVFGGEVTRQRIAMAIAAFERTLISVNSPLDKYLKGDKTLYRKMQKRLRIFKDKGCLECHHGVNLSDDKFYALNVPENPDLLDEPRSYCNYEICSKGLSL